MNGIPSTMTQIDHVVFETRCAAAEDLIPFDSMDLSNAVAEARCFESSTTAEADVAVI